MPSFVHELELNLTDEVFRSYGVRSMREAERKLADSEINQLTEEAESFITSEVCSLPPPLLFDVISKDTDLFTRAMQFDLDHLQSSPYIKVLNLFDAVQAAVIDVLLNDILA